MRWARPYPVRTLPEWLDELVRDPDGDRHEPWLRTCALHAVPGRVEPLSATALATPWRADQDPAVAQTARWVGWIVAGAARGAGVRQPRSPGRRSR